MVLHINLAIFYYKKRKNGQLLLKKEEKEWKKVLDISWRTRYNNYRSLEKIEGTFAGD